MQSKPHIVLVFLLVMIVSAARAQNQSIDAGCGANIGSVANATVSVTIDCQKQQTTAPLSIQYVRLFGGSEVPLLMALFGKTDLASAAPWSKKFRVIKRKGQTDANDAPELVHVKLIRFFNRYSFKDANPLLTKIWADIDSNVFAAEMITWRASAGNRKERLCFYANDLVDESGFFVELLIDKKLIRNKKSCDPTIRAFNQRIGFTFLVFQNDSNEPLTDVTFKFRQTYESNRLQGEYPDLSEYLKTEALSQIPKMGSPVESLISLYGSAADIERRTNERSVEELYAARIEPKQKLIALLNVYLANEKNLPATYLSGL